MSYVVEAAIGIDDKSATATRGWFRIDPAACRVVLQGASERRPHPAECARARRLRTPPIPQNGSDTLCIAPENFRHRRRPPVPRQPDARALHPDQSDADRRRPSLVAYLAEDPEYDDEQARLAGIQRLLVIAGYDAALDRRRRRTEDARRAAIPEEPRAERRYGAVAEFLHHHDRGRPDAPRPAIGLTWCNDTPHKIMAAVATDDGKTVTSRGWYRIDPGKCLHPDVTGQPKQIYSFAEAVDAENRTVKYREKPLNWGGAKELCTRESKFEINEQGDCGTRGLAATALPPVDMSSGGKTLRFAMP